MDTVMKPKVVVFNMTARSGKDEAVKYLMKEFEELNPKHLSFKDKLIDTTLNFFNIAREIWDQRYEAENPKGDIPKWKKDEPWDWLKRPRSTDCFSQRSALIYVSEEVVKPVFGNSAFGDAVANELEDGGLYFVSDGGFDEEQLPLLAKADVLFIKRDRLGTNWAGDSRGWISEGVGGVHRWISEDVTDLEDYLEDVGLIVAQWIYDVNRGLYNEPF